MRELPDNASLDHLRRQAKDLLAVLRQNERGVTLTDAQAVLARQHGFEAWADLKAEVARRNAAVKLVADAALAEQLGAVFDLGAVRGPMRHVEHQWAGQTWELTAARGRWVLTELAGYVVPTDVEVEADLVRRAVAHGVLAPEPVVASDGSFVACIEGTNWRAHRWMQLGPPPPQPPPTEVAAEGGRILARVHDLGLPASKPVVPWLTHRWGASRWEEIIDRARTANSDWADDLALAVPGFLELDAVCDPADPNPRAILSKAWHAPAGVRRAGTGQLVAIGWEHASATPKDWELGACLMHWSETLDGDHDLFAARAFLAGYREIEEDIPITLSMFTSGVTANLNWTISRANIALGEDDKDRRELAERNIRMLARNPFSIDQVRRLADALA